MSGFGSVGLQWKLAGVLTAVSLLGTGLVTGGYLVGIKYWEMAPTAALAVGSVAGLLVGLAGSVLTIRSARRMKMRLWEAGDMAGRIARGDFQARVPVEGSDEIGLLEEQLNQMATQLESAVAQLRGLAEQNRHLAEEAGRGVALEERANLARDLHDTVNQQLFVLTMRTAAVRKRLEKIGGEAATLVPELSSLEALAREAHAETRGLILQLRPTSLDQQGLGLALAEYVKATAGREGWEAIIEIDPAIRPAAPIGASLFRLVQESLNNVAKHAQANTIWITLSGSDGHLILKVRDDGEGFDLKAGVRPTAVGLLGMQERIAALGGQLKVRSAPGEGTEIAVSLDLRTEALDHD